MIPSKNILIVFPHNFFEKGSGVNKRYFELVSYLKRTGFSVDLLGLRHFECTWEKFESENSDKLIRHLFLYDFRMGFNLDRLKAVFTRLNFTSKRKKKVKSNHLPDFSFPGMIKLFKKITTNNRYDFIIIGYVYWANLIRENFPPDVIKVLTIEDFISQKLHETKPDSFDLDESIKEEVERVNLFDRVICLSHEEMQFFSTRATHPGYFFVPVFLDEPIQVVRTKEYDILFIGFDNEDNIEGLDWFFKHVYPLLPADLKIIVIGKIARYALELPTVTRMEYVDEPGEIYPKSKVSINPLQKGTGMKVKVIESLAYGIPIVNTLKGLCGIPPRLLNEFIIAGDPQSFAGEICHLLSDANWYNEKSREAKRTFLNYFDVTVAKKELDKIFSGSI